MKDYQTERFRVSLKDFNKKNNEFTLPAMQQSNTVTQKKLNG